MTSWPPRLAPGELRVWHAESTALASRGLVERARDWLQPRERERYERFFRDEDRDMFLLGRVMARALVGAALNVAPTAWPWRDGPHGRPEIDVASTPVRFNLAHSAGLVVCALASGRDVGVDVEHLSRRPVEKAVVHRYCAAAEIADIESQGDAWHDRFLEYWTLKEAYLKARGVGISLPLSEISFAPRQQPPRIAFSGSLTGADDGWLFHLARPTADHLLAVAAPTTANVPPTVRIEPLAVESLSFGPAA